MEFIEYCADVSNCETDDGGDSDNNEVSLSLPNLSVILILKITCRIVMV